MGGYSAQVRVPETTLRPTLKALRASYDVDLEFVDVVLVYVFKSVLVCKRVSFVGQRLRANFE